MKVNASFDIHAVIAVEPQESEMTLSHFSVYFNTTIQTFTHDFRN